MTQVVGDVGTTASSLLGNRTTGDQKPTPVETEGNCACVNIANEDGDVVAEIHIDGPHAAKYAEIIGAVPDMFDALQFYASASVTSPTPGTNFRNCDDGRLARAAIAKACGGKDV